MEEKKGMQTLERGLKVMEYLGSVNRKGATVQEIARACGLARPVVYRILETLGQNGYIYRDESDRFRLGVALLRLAASCLAGHDLATASLPEMQDLRDATGATISLFVRRGSERVCIQRVYGSEATRLIHIGDGLPLQGASGKVILVFDEACPEGERRTVSAELLNEVRANGWALTLGERESGVGALAVPVFRATVFQGAISLSLPVYRLAEGRHEEFLPVLLEHARRLSDQLTLM